MEGERLDWCRRNQPLLRCETLQGLADYLGSVAVPCSASAVSAHQPCPEASSVADIDFLGEAAPALQPERHADAEKPRPVSGPGRPVILPASYS
eukprot:3737455-Karenia_brevis.AAC.1